MLVLGVLTLLTATTIHAATTTSGHCSFQLMHRMTFDGVCAWHARVENAVECALTQRMFRVLHVGRRHYEADDCKNLFVGEPCSQSIVYHGAFERGWCDEERNCVSTSERTLSNAKDCGGVHEQMNVTLPIQTSARQYRYFHM